MLLCVTNYLFIWFFLSLHCCFCMPLIHNGRSSLWVSRSWGVSYHSWWALNRLALCQRQESPLGFQVACIVDLIFKWRLTVLKCRISKVYAEKSTGRISDLRATLTNSVQFWHPEFPLTLWILLLSLTKPFFLVLSLFI